MKTIPIKTFLHDRQIWRQRVLDAESKFPEFKNVILDPGDDLVCDLCNDDVLEDPLHVHEGMLLCPRCRKRQGLA